MNTLVLFDYTGLLFEGVPEGLLTALSTVKLVEISGYGSTRIIKPAEGKQIEVQFVQNPGDETPLLAALKESQKEANDERNKRYTMESKLEKLQKRFGVEE